jgi:hypothetical protein
VCSIRATVSVPVAVGGRSVRVDDHIVGFEFETRWVDELLGQFEAALHCLHRLGL